MKTYSKRYCSYIHKEVWRGYRCSGEDQQRNVTQMFGGWSHNFLRLMHGMGLSYFHQLQFNTMKFFDVSYTVITVVYAGLLCCLCMCSSIGMFMIWWLYIQTTLMYCFSYGVVMLLERYQGNDRISLQKQTGL